MLELGRCAWPLSHFILYTAVSGVLPLLLSVIFLVALLTVSEGYFAITTNV